MDLENITLLSVVTQTQKLLKKTKIAYSLSYVDPNFADNN